MWLMTLDVNSLYMCIPHELGIKANQHFLRQRVVNYFMHTEMLLSMMQICLSNNYFLFDHVIFCQTRGKTLGTWFSPSYAGLYLGWWEEQVASNITAFTQNVILWARHIDDVFCIWKGTEQEALQFVVTLNDNQCNLNFTSMIHKQTIEFLDVVVRVQDDKLESRLFRKATAGNSLLHAKSCHPKNLIHSIPYGEHLRAKRNCSSEQVFQHGMLNMRGRFLERGYPSKVIEQACTKIKSVVRGDLLKFKPVTLNEEDHIRFITAYSNQSWQVRKCLRKYWHVLHTDPISKKHVGIQPKVTFRKCIALTDILCSSTLKQEKDLRAVQGFFTCYSCKACKNNVNHKEFTLSKDHKPHVISKHLTCKSDYCVYALSCPCSLVYIESTIHQVKKACSGAHEGNCQ